MKDPRPTIPSNCLSISARDGYRVEFEAEAIKVHGGYEVWFSLFDGEELCSSAGVQINSLDRFTLRALAIGYAEGWDHG